MASIGVHGTGHPRFEDEYLGVKILIEGPMSNILGRVPICGSLEVNRLGGTCHRPDSKGMSVIYIAPDTYRWVHRLLRHL